MTVYSSDELISKDKLGKSQKTLLERRIFALKVAVELIEREMKNEPQNL